MKDSSTNSFTGRQRERKTRKSVLYTDRAAQALVSVGGIGTIIAVLGVFVFLVWVAVPLFLPATLDNIESFEASKDDALHLGIDEYQLLSWILRTDGTLDVFRLDTGDRVDTIQLVDQPIRDASFSIGGELVSLALDTGEVQLATVGFETSIVDSLEPALQSVLDDGDEDTVVAFENGVVQRTPAGQYRIQRLVAELGRAVRVANGPVWRVGHAIGPNGPLVVSLAEHRPEVDAPDTALDSTSAAEDVTTEDAATEDTATEDPASEDPATENAADDTVAIAEDSSASGEPTMLLSLIAGVEESNFLTGQTTLEFSEPEVLPYEALSDGLPSHVAMTGSGNTVYVVWDDGSLLRIDRTLSPPILAEKGALFPPDETDRTLTALGFGLGNNTLVWGDSKGRLHAGFQVDRESFEGDPELQSRGLYNVERHPETFQVFVESKTLGEDRDVAVRSLASSARTRLMLAGFDDGSIELYNITNASRLMQTRLPSEESVALVQMAPKEDGLAAITTSKTWLANLDPRYPEASIAALFRPVWYEGYNRPEHTWQSSSGTDDFEVKLGLVPLIFGTVKATVYSMMFGVPLALLAALFTSEYLGARTKSFIKPSVELMASLPSVVLGFLAALVFAPFIEKWVPATLAAFATLPFTFLLGAFLWQLLPLDVSLRHKHWRFGLMVLAVPLGLVLAALLGPLVERWLFAGDLKGWLAWDPGDPRGEMFASSVGGWMMLWFPISLVLVLVGVDRWGNPALRKMGKDWDRQRFALVDLGKMAASLLAVIGLAFILSYICQSLGFDPRGGYVDTYVQRNALIVGFVMGFAIIPIIYTISEDALSTVPEHLRSASLGAGATTWQTATRIVVPTAMSGLFSACMVGLGRAVGETMIVLMAAGNTPVLEWNIFEGFRTLSANIAVELPEAVQGSTHYRTLFLAALVLFVMTFAVNTVAEVIRQRFRKRAYQL